MAKLTAVIPEQNLPREFGRNLMGITYIADDFDAPLPDHILKEFGF